MRHSVAMTLITRERRGPLEIWTLDRAERLNALPDPQDGEAFAEGSLGEGQALLVGEAAGE